MGLPLRLAGEPAKQKAGRLTAKFITNSRFKFLLLTFQHLVGPPETRATFNRLKSEGFSELDSKKLIAQAIVAEIFWMKKKKENFNLARFVRNLN
jgi:hypothetical protein